MARTRSRNPGAIAGGGSLKHDLLGTIRVDPSGRPSRVIRDPTTAAAGLRWLARRLAKREARALIRLGPVAGVPDLVDRDGCRVIRAYLPGLPLHRAPRPDQDWFRAARRLLRRIHRAGVAHNDLAKEANWLRLDDGGCGIVDFQLAHLSRRRHAWFRLLAREDVRHLLKHKRLYCPESLTARERAMLSRPSWLAQCVRFGIKPLYRIVTRRLLGWPEREGAEERTRPAA